ncbi:MAG TPA: hypothetical protein VKU00_24600, partial [Chthonomonadaceae bacterium]|nr:hypothetical protein [Chthonomonadaceae bacterium]
MYRNSGREGWWIAPAAVALLTVPGCQVASGATDWVKHNNPRGFTLEHPAGWTVEMPTGKPILIASADKRSFVVVQPSIAEEGETAQSWVQQVPQRFASLFPKAHIEGIHQGRQVPDEAVADLTFTQEGQPMRGKALCWIQQRSVMLYAIAAPTARFERDRGSLLHILDSFRFTVPSEPKEKSQAANAQEYVTWKDPMEGGFSLEVPRNWNVQGGVKRLAAVDVRSEVEATSPDGAIRVQLGDARIPTFTMPNVVLAQGGFREGSWYSPGYGVNLLVMRYQPGAQFARYHAQHAMLQGATDVRFTRQQDRADTTYALNRIYAQFGQAGTAVHLDAGETAFQYSNHGLPMQGYCFAGTLSTQVQGSFGGLWQVPHLCTYLAPQGREAEAQAVMQRMVATYRIDPDWANRNAQIAANVSQIVTKTNDEIMKIWKSSTDYRNHTLDDIHRHFDNYILDRVDVEDPVTHETWKAEAGHNWYYRK